MINRPEARREEVDALTRHISVTMDPFPSDGWITVQVELDERKEIAFLALDGRSWREGEPVYLRFPELRGETLRPELDEYFSRLRDCVPFGHGRFISNRPLELAVFEALLAGWRGEDLRRFIAGWRIARKENSDALDSDL